MLLLEVMMSYKNPLLHTTLSLILAFTLSFFNLPLLFLYALQTYIHPDSQPQQSNGLRPAIRRPGSTTESPELRKRNNKSKDKPSDFDENNAQIFRLTLDQSHLHSRLYIDHYSVAFTVSFVTLCSLLLHNYLGSDKNHGFLESGFFVPVLLSILSLYMWVMLFVRVTFERSASRRSEKQFSVIFGVLGLFFGLLVVVPDGASLVYLDFDFVIPVYGFWRVLAASLIGCFSGFLFIPAGRGARSFWLGTDQIRCNMSMITCGWFARLILYANQIFVIFVALLWIKPLAEIFVNTNNHSSKGASAIKNGFGNGNAEKLVGNLGLTPSEFSNFRQWCLLGSSLLQIMALRPNLQMYLNEALLSWYQRLHASKVPDLDYSRAKMFLHNHFLCLVVLQFLGPPMLVLLFLGLSQIDGPSFGDFPLLSNLLPSFAFVNQVALFLAWWVTFLWALFSSVILMLHRHCILYVS